MPPSADTSDDDGKRLASGTNVAFEPSAVSASLVIPAFGSPAAHLRRSRAPAEPPGLRVVTVLGQSAAAAATARRPTPGSSHPRPRHRLGPRESRETARLSGDRHGLHLVDVGHGLLERSERRFAHREGFGLPPKPRVLCAPAVCGMVCRSARSSPAIRPRCAGTTSTPWRARGRPSPTRRSTPAWGTWKTRPSATTPSGRSSTASRTRGRATALRTRPAPSPGPNSPSGGWMTR